MRQFIGIIAAFVLLLVMLKGWPKVFKGKKAPLGPVLVITGLIMAIIGGRPVSSMVDAAVKKMARCPIIQWSIDPEDWSDTDTQRQVAHIVNQAKDGDIILLHDIYPSSVETALQVVDKLLAEGFYFVTVDELFAASEIGLEDGQVYMHARG